MTRWLVDGMNVIGSRPDRWWRDRAKAMRSLAESLADFRAETGEPVTLFLDGSPLEPPIDADGVEVRFAPGGPNAADREIVAALEADRSPREVRVVTSDAKLSERARELGAEAVGAGSFRSRHLDRR
jgi:predicted RNA-binding protein with PIN domain